MTGRAAATTMPPRHASPSPQLMVAAVNKSQLFYLMPRHLHINCRQILQLTQVQKPDICGSMICPKFYRVCSKLL